MSDKVKILVVTPEITYLPHGMGNLAQRLNAKAGGLADVSASLVAALTELEEVEVHVALPHYRQMFQATDDMDVANLAANELRAYQQKLPSDQIHLAEDRIFYYRDQVYSGYSGEVGKVANVFQREVINNILPRVNPQLIHCNDWMTGLIPGAARRLGIPCLFTLHNIHTEKMTLAAIEDSGIDAASFWGELFYERTPHGYEESRDDNRVDYLASGIFASHFINTVSPSFLAEIVDGQHNFIPDQVRAEIVGKFHAKCALGILNAPDATFDPETDVYLPRTYGASDHTAGKAANKAELQRALGLEERPDAPILFWPSRLDPVQKGPHLLTEILFDLIRDYDDIGLQVAVVANGGFQQHFHDIVNQHGIHSRVGIRNFTEALSHIGYAGSDFMVMPSSFEPCGLPQMVSPIYGTLPIVHNTGGLKDTVEPLDVDTSQGNGFRFDVFDALGFRWSIDQAIEFWKLPEDTKHAQLSRIMTQSKKSFSHAATAKEYIDIYGKMLKRTFVRRETSAP
ncbi:MAG: starch synthase [Verrucomicrobiales bacterium]|jgi:starch synthase